MYLNNDKIMFDTNFMFYLTCSEGHYYFVEFLFQGCVRVEGVCVCVWWRSEALLKHWPVVQQKQDLVQ